MVWWKLWVGAAYRQKIESWPKIPANDVSGLRRVSNFLVQCEKAVNKIGSHEILNDDQENRKLVTKLLKWAIDCWSRVIHQFKTEKGTFLPFFDREFVKFFFPLKLILHAILLFHLSLWKTNDDERRSKILKKSVCFFTNKGSKTAGFCKGRYDLDECKEFKEKDMPSRKEYTSTNEFCFGCLEPGHLSRMCTERKVCEICRRLHPKPFHGDSKRQEGNEGSWGGNRDSKNDSEQLTQDGSTTCLMTDQGKEQVSSLFVPVWLFTKEDPSHKLLVVSLLVD